MQINWKSKYSVIQQKNSTFWIDSDHIRERDIPSHKFWLNHFTILVHKDKNSQNVMCGPIPSKKQKNKCQQIRQLQKTHKFNLYKLFCLKYFFLSIFLKGQFKLRRNRMSIFVMTLGKWRTHLLIFTIFAYFQTYVGGFKKYF